MSTETPNLGLQYLDPSQAQPEVKVNDAWNKLDAAIGTVAVSDATTSPPIVRRAVEIKFDGATVTHETGGVARVHIDGGGSGGGGSPIDVTDGTTDVANVTAIRFTSGAVVSASSGSVADVAISGGGGATFLNASISPDSHPETPSARDDEFEGTTLDAKWAWLNQNTATATFANPSGSVNLTSSVNAGTDLNAITQALAGGSAFDYRARVSQQISANYHQGGMLLRESGTGKILRFIVYFSSGTPTYSVDKFSNATTSAGNIASGAIGLPIVFATSVPWYYVRMQLLSGNYIWSVSMTGEEGTFNPVAIVAQTAYFTTGADEIGLMVASQNASTAGSMYVDWFRDYTAGYTPAVGGGNFFNVSPDQHTSTPTFAENDEFEAAAGTPIDTAGTRFPGAVAWTWGNQGTSTALQSGDGNLILLGQADGNYHGVYQPVPGGAWKRRCRVSLMNAAASAGDLASIFALNSSNGHIVGFGPFANTPGILLIKWNSWTSFNSTGYNTLPRNYTSQMIVQPTWYEMRSDGTTLTFAVSETGAEGSFIDVTTETIASFLGAVDNVGLSISTNSSPPSALITDLWRKY